MPTSPWAAVTEPRASTVKQRSNKCSVQDLTGEDVPLATGDDLFLRSEAHYRFLSHLPWDKPSVAWAGPVPRRKNSPDRTHRLVQTMKQMPPPQRTCYSSGHQWDNHRGWRCLQVLLGNSCFRVGRLIKMSCGSLGRIWSENDVADWLLCVCVCVCVCVCLAQEEKKADAFVQHFFSTYVHISSG